MKIFPQIITALVLVFIAFTSCNKEESTWEKYKDWREANTAFFESKSSAVDKNGNAEYLKISPNWDNGSYILMKRLKEGSGSKNPLYTSTVDVKYKGILYNGTTFDSTYMYTDSITTFRCSSTILGFAIALTNMVVGDSCEIIIPSYLGYGEQELTNIKPYSTLTFGVKLTAIPGYEKPVVP